MHRRTFLQAVIMLTAGICFRDQADKEPVAPLSSLLTAVRKRYAVPALTAAAVHVDGTTVVGRVGTRRAGARDPVQSSDAFHIGSCTKAMTATLTAILVERGRLSWETTIAEAFADLKGRIRPEYRNVSLLQLLSHRGGLPDDRKPDPTIFPVLRSATAPLNEQRRMLAELILTREPAYTPGERMVYSNFGYAIAGAIVEQAVGRPWENLMREYLFEPLGMATAGFGPPRKVWGHRHVDAECQPVQPGPFADNPPAIGPAGSVHCSIADWAKFAALHLRGARGDTGLLLKPQSFQLLHTDRFRQGYALGWSTAERSWAHGITLSHTGSNTMWFAAIFIAPKRGTAFLACANCGGGHAAEACDTAVANMVKQATGAS
ncbi:MAG: serine hydrolase domain-containing protein [Armatimonadota bacterium]